MSDDLIRNDQINLQENFDTILKDFVRPNTTHESDLFKANSKNQALTMLPEHWLRNLKKKILK